MKPFKSLQTNCKNAFRTLLAARAARALREAAGHARTIEEALELAEHFNYYGIKIDPSQVRTEILQLLNLLAASPPKTVLEIGALRGGTLFLFTRVAAPDALVISMDLPPGRPGWGYPPWRQGILRSFARERQRVELVLADSHDPATVGEVQKVLAGRKIDFLLIDGDHRYEGVKADFEMYSPLVQPGGWIAFHDIVPRRTIPCGVPQMWQEVKQGRTAREFVADWKQDGFGIGVIQM